MHNCNINFSLFLLYLLKVDLEFSKLTDGKEDLFIRKWEGTIIPKLKEIASLEKKMDISQLLEKADSQHDGMIYASVWHVHTIYNVENKIKNETFNV